MLSWTPPAKSRGELLPDPTHDRIECIFFALQEEDVVITDPVERRASYFYGCVAIDSENMDPTRLRDSSVELVGDELALINAVVDRVREWDPDILTGYELQNSSWGYISQRAWQLYGKFFQMVTHKCCSDCNSTRIGLPRADWARDGCAIESR